MKLLNFNNIFSRLVLIISLLSIFTYSAYSQTINTKFGKNRVQYHDDFNDWWMYDMDNYTVYWYGKERNIAKTVILLSQISYSEIEELLDYKINKKIQLILYSNLSDFKQTNLGIKLEDLSSGPGITKFYENKIIIYYDGNHNHLLEQIKEGTAKVFLKNMYSELTFENVYKKLVYSDFPTWFIAGSIDYLSGKWNIRDDDKLRNIFVKYNKKNIDFEKFSLNSPGLFGKSFFVFLETKYGKKTISDIYYLIRISRDLQSSFLNVTAKTLEELFEDWEEYNNAYYKNYIQNSTDLQKNGLLKIESQHPFTSISLSENSKYLTYAVNNRGKIDLYLYVTENKSKKKILKSGYINTTQETNLSFPLTAFNKESTKLAILYEKRNVKYLQTINLINFESHTEPLSPEYRDIYNIDFWDNENLILNGSIDGYDDLFKYSIKLRQSERLTQDIWDDLDAKTCIYNGKKGIVFSSNRPNTLNNIKTLDTTLPIGNFNIFYLDLDTKLISQLTFSDSSSNKQPFIHNSNLTYLSDETGIFNIKEKNITSDNSFFISNSTTNILNYFSNKFSHITYTNNLCNHTLSLEKKDKNKRYTPIKTNLKNSLFNQKTIKKEKEIMVIDYGNLEIDSTLLFQTKFSDPEKNTTTLNTNQNLTIKTQKEKKTKIIKFNSSRAIASRLRFSFTELITKIDNEPLFDGMETYTSSQNSYVSPSSGFLIKSRVKDIFEDYFLESGVRISSDFNEKEYFSVFENLKRKIDWQYAYYRKSRSKNEFNRPRFIDKYKMVINMAQVRAKYPFDVYQSLSITSRLRFDKNTILASDTISLNQPDFTEQRFSLKLEYIFDNTSKIGTNLYLGNRSKAYIETYNRFNIRFNSPSEFDPSTGLMTVLGFDSRQYYRLFSKSILAFRFAGQTSFGSERNIYFLGGVENWQFSKQEDLAPYPSEDDYAFKVLAANLRGFGYNARNGSSFVLMNSEIRIPIFHLLFGYKLKKSFFKDFQIIGFFDTGLAWNGISPFSEDNPSNTQVIEIPPSIILKLKYYTDPLIAGYGFGVRTTVFGYFLKLDYAWGIETRKVKDPILYLSMGYDF